MVQQYIIIHLLLQKGQCFKNEILNETIAIKEINEFIEWRDTDGNIITKIDISNSADYKLTVASQNKTIRMGGMTNINIKLQMAGKVFEAESGKSGEIYFQNDGKKAIFKEDVAR